MKIVYVITRADAVGGASIHVRDMARAMRERGHDAVVLVGGRGPVTELFEDAGVPFLPLAFLRRAVNPLRDIEAMTELMLLLRQWKPDLVSAHTAKAGWLARAVCARLRLPAIYTPHGWSVGDRISRLAGAVFTAAERAAARWTGAFVCVCEYEKRLAVGKRIGLAERFHVVHNGVQDVPASLRAAPGADVPAVRICSIARLDAPKDHATLLRALGTLKAQPWELDLVGDGPLEHPLRALAAELGIAGRVHFRGYQTDPARCLAAAQIFVLSSRSEGFPRSILEAMRAGLPVVASDVGGVSEAITHQEQGLLVPPGDAAALGAALGGLLGDGQTRGRMGAAARAAYEARFRVEVMIENTAAVYGTVLDRTSESRRTT